MWIMTSDGFISVVELPEADRLSELTHLDLSVRARERTVLVKLVDEMKQLFDGRWGYEVVGPIMHIPNRDYQWRVYVDRTAFSTWVQNTVRQIDYENFKQSTEAPGRGGRKLHELYVQIWQVVAYHYQTRRKAS